MRTKEALKILEGDFSEVVIEEGKSHADYFAEAFAMAKESLEKVQELEAKSKRIAMFISSTGEVEVLGGEDGTK